MNFISVTPFTVLLLTLINQLVVGSSNSIKAEDFLVEGLEEIEPAFATFDGRMHAGLISIDEDINAQDQGKLMFWLYEPHHPTVDDSLVIWFNGGPGCSSFHAGMLLEMGPITTPLQPAGSFGQPKNATYGPNPYAWTHATAVLYVEQPVGVGFSYGGDPPMDENDVARDFYHFLQNFNSLFPDMAAKRLFLFAESYGGMYVPGIAHYIYKKNKEKFSKKINLHGIALGNGWADVVDQGGMVIDYAWWHGMIDSVTRNALHVEMEHCLHRTGSEPDPFHPFTTPDECGMMEAVLKAAGGGLLDSRSINTYDVTTFDMYKILTEHGNVNELFFNDPRVREKLHVSEEVDKDWRGCIPGAGRRRRRHLARDLHKPLPGEVLLKDDTPLNMAPYLADLLDDAKIRVLVYNGDRDMSTCAQGSEIMLDGMEWTGSSDWHDPNAEGYRRALWMVNDYPAGWAKTVKNLDFVVVYNSGHLAPYNVPVQALDLVTRFVSGSPYGDVTIPVIFDPVVLGKPFPNLGLDETTRGGSQHSFVSALMGFLLGIGCVMMYLHFGKAESRGRYELVGNANV